MSYILKRFGEVMYQRKLTKGKLVIMIAEKNHVSRQTVYNWLKSGSEIEVARMNAALDEIESDLEKQEV